MKIYERKFYLIAALCFAGFNIAAFIIYHILINVITATWCIYVAPLFTKIVNILPLLAGGVILAVTSGTEGGRRPYLYTIVISLTQILYVTPYLYLRCINQGYDSIESLVMGLIGSLPEIIVFYGGAVLISFIIKFITKIRKQDFSEQLESTVLFDFDNGACLGVFAAAALGFFYLLVMEVIDTVAFLIEYAGDYTVGEIVYICVCFTVDLAALFIYHLILMFIKNIAVGAVVENN